MKFAPRRHLLLLLLLAVAISLSTAQPTGRPIVPFDFAPLISIFFRRLEQPVQHRTVFIYAAAWYNSLVIHSETGRFVNGTEPMQRFPDLTDEDLGLTVASIVAAATLHVFGETDAIATQVRANDLLNLTLPIRAQDVEEDDPNREGLLRGFKIAGELIEQLEADGFNEAGTDDGSEVNLLPYEDVTGYSPINSPHFIKDLRRWTPLVESLRPESLGAYSVQQFVMPQVAFVDSPILGNAFSRNLFVPTPYRNEIRTGSTCDPEKRSEQTGIVPAICRDADEMLAMNANLTDKQIANIQYFDDPILSLTLNVIPLSAQINATLREALIFVLLANGGIYETNLVVWREKRRHDAVATTTLVNQLYKDVDISHGSDVKKQGQDFASFVRTRSRPEYPSLNAATCQYYADATSAVLGTTEVSFDFDASEVSSTDVTIEIRDVQRDIADACSESRIMAGTNLRPAVEMGRELGRKIAPEFINRLSCLAPDNRILPPCVM